jgi:hypothetical protein
MESMDKQWITMLVIVCSEYLPIIPLIVTYDVHRAMLCPGCDIAERKAAMRSKALLITSAVAGVIMSTTLLSSIPARAQSPREAEMIGFHELCEKGDRRACVRFGILIGQNQERHAEWRRSHAAWFWWER